MGKASSSKKIKRVQQAGVSRAPGQRRNLAYPALIVGIVVVGVVLVFVARDSRQATASEAPTTRDHWHQAFALNICGENQANPSDTSAGDRYGIHTHQDGLIHVHPFGASASGENATFGVFAQDVGITIDETSVTLPDGKTKTNGDKCDGKAATWTLYKWPPQANDKTEPETVTGTAINDERFTEDGGAYLLSFNPKGFKPSLPPSISELANPSDVEPGSSSGGLNSATTSTTVAGQTPTTAAGATTTTVAGQTTTTAKAAG